METRGIWSSCSLKDPVEPRPGPSWAWTDALWRLWQKLVVALIPQLL
ncbi:unnamed protein product [Gulo gulo]|uniref:Uncharacterized protein n=1 Tax=Gulo gulo TaxID=48420 RepID=A0A9X9Q6F8_GULGU|nr:unnamed protein product [Gulo gulo]